MTLEMGLIAIRLLRTSMTNAVKAVEQNLMGSEIPQAGAALRQLRSEETMTKPFLVIVFVSCIFPAMASGGNSCTDPENAISPQFDHGDADPMYRALVNFGEVRTDVASITKAKFKRPPYKQLMFGLLLSSDRTLLDFGPEGVRGLFDSLSNPKLRVTVTDESGVIAYSQEFGLRELELRDSSFRGVPSGFHAELPGRFRSFAYLSKGGAKRVELAANRMYCHTVEVISPGNLPSDVRVFAVAIAPGWKQVTM